MISDEQISKNRTKAWRSIREEMGRDVYFVGSTIYLGESIKTLSEADAANYLDGWEEAKK